jgi:hypothetical protein
MWMLGLDNFPGGGWSQERGKKGGREKASVGMKHEQMSRGLTTLKGGCQKC